MKEEEGKGDSREERTESGVALPLHLEG